MWAEYEFGQRQVLADGASKAEHLDSARDQVAKIGKLATLADLKGQPAAGKSLVPTASREDLVPEFPYPLLYLWGYFLEISDAVPHDDYGAPQILWTELMAWSQLSGIWLEPWELEAIIWVGRVGQTVAARAYTERMKKPSNG